MIARLALVLLVMSLTLLASVATAADRPNVIIILSDDQGYGDFSCHGNPALKTPHLDRLHDQSIRLVDFHVAPMCTPTRGQLLTGYDACRSGATSVCAGRSFVRRTWPAAHGSTEQVALPPNMAELFQQAGYKTALFGKWHLGDSYPNLPYQRGFQETVYHLGWGITSMADLWRNDYFNGRFSHNGTMQEYPGYCTDVWFNLASDWIKERHKTKEPFFLYLPTNAPHGPLWVEDKYRKPYLDQKLPRPLSSFFGMIANLDENVGKLDQLLEETGLRDNTIVIYFHDNGGTVGVNYYNAGMRAGKTTYYDGGHRAACFIRWPNGGLQVPKDINELTEVQDLLPTLIELCGMKWPGVPRDGVSLAALLKGKTDKLDDRKLVVQYGQKPEKWQSAVMWQKWRLVHGTELYDLRTDPAQKTNVAADRSDILKQMRDHYELWWSGVEPLLTDFVPVVIGAKEQNPVTLCSSDWENVYCDNMNDLRTGKEINAPWNIEVAQDGAYEIALRRWPKEADAPITGSVPEFLAVDGKLPVGRAMPIKTVRLKIGSFDQKVAVEPDAKEVKFTMDLKATAKTQMQSYFYDESGKELSGAYFAYVRRQD